MTTLSGHSRKLLQKGSSQPWTQVMQEITGSPKMSTAAMKEYFQPLTDWLKEHSKGKVSKFNPKDVTLNGNFLHQYATLNWIWRIVNNHTCYHLPLIKEHVAIVNNMSTIFYVSTPRKTSTWKSGGGGLTLRQQRPVILSVLLGVINSSLP